MLSISIYKSRPEKGSKISMQNARAKIEKYRNRKVEKYRIIKMPKLKNREIKKYKYTKIEKCKVEI